MKRNKFSLFITILLLGFFVFSSVSSSNLTPVNAENNAQQDQESETMRTVSVNGNGQVEATPDVAVIQLGVQTDAKTANEAMTENNTKMQSVVDSLISAGINRNDIQTQTINLSPRYEQDTTTNNRNLAGYIATNTVSVRTEDLSSLGTLLDSAVNAGANRIQNIQFDISDPQDLLDQAREAAVADARHKAEQLAEFTGATLGSVITIQENSNVPVPAVRETAFNVAAADVPVQSGTQNVNVQVQITWSLVDNN